jgi:hypothetical protein
MIRELSWYLESGRFSQTAEELEGSLRRYAEAKDTGAQEDVMHSLREDARALFEDHCTRSGLRSDEAAYINIDAEFFNGNTLDETAMNSFIKNIIKGHCYQKVLWTYMGTTGLFTQISKSEMTQAGLNYDDYLPLEYKKNWQLKKPLEASSGKSAMIFYQYGDGTVSTEYIQEKAKVRFDRLADNSGMDWKAGYDPNGSVKKDGWYGVYDYTGTWVRVDKAEDGNVPVNRASAVTLELIRDGNTAILYDPGMQLLTSPLLLYVTESGEPYGELSPDRERTVKEIDKALKSLGVTGISAIGGITDGKPELLEAYREVLGGRVLPELKAIENKNVLEIKEGLEQEAAVVAAESTGINLEKKLRVAGRNETEGAVILSSIAAGSIAVPLSAGKPADLYALGLNEEEAAELIAAPVRAEHEAAYNTVLSNLYAAWSCYAGSMNRLEAAQMVLAYLEGTDADKIPAEITAQTTLGEIIFGNSVAEKDGVSLYASGIPGVFREPDVVDFFDESAKEKYLQTLQRRRVLPKNGAVAALAALQGLPIKNGERKAELNRRLTLALGEYKTISASTGMPITEVIEAAKGENAAALSKKVYYELPLSALIAAALKENMQKREANLEEAAENCEETIIIGGVSGPALDEVLLTRETLTAGGISGEEADKARNFLHGIRFASVNPVIPPFLLEALKENKTNTAVALRKSILEKLEGHEGTVYNLSTDEGLRSYSESGRAKVPKKEVQELLQEELKKNGKTAVSVSRVDIKYRDESDIAPLERNVPKGNPEKIQLAKFPGMLAEKTGYGSNTAELGTFDEKTLIKEYGYSAPEAKAASEYFQNIRIPAGREQYFMREISPVLRSIVRGTNTAPELKERISGIFGKEMINTVPLPAKIETSGIYSGEPAKDVFFDWGRSAPVTGIADRNSTFLRVPQEEKYNVAVSGTAVDFSMHEPEAAEIAVTDNNAAESRKHAVLFPRKTARDAELERLRKMEANFEKDKASMPRQKQPALARSESHDVGHAEGTGEMGSSKQFFNELSDRVVEKLKRKAGL